MMAILTVTGAAGFGVSYTLLHLGVVAMAVRYPVALLAAYGVFLVLLRVWLWTRRRAERRARRRGSRSDWDLVDVVDGVPSGGGGGGGGGGGIRFGGGGGFSGGGAGGTWEPAPGTPMVVPMPRASGGGASYLSRAGGGAGGKSGGGWKLPGLDLDLDDDSGGLIAIVLVIGIVVAIVAAASYVVLAAPTLLAEVLVDGIVLAGLYRRVRDIDDTDWFRTALRKTWLPAAALALILALAGWGIQAAVPAARSIGDAWRIPAAQKHARSTLP